MIVLYGHQPRPLGLSATRKYLPEEIHETLDRLVRADQALFLQVENEHIRVRPGVIGLAAAAVASYHNQIAYNAAPMDDWEEETRDMEMAAAAGDGGAGGPDERD